MKKSSHSTTVLACAAIAVLAVAAIAAARNPDVGTRIAGLTAVREDPDGRMLYLKNCRTCHGATGMPSGENKEKYPKIKALNDSAFLAKLSDDSLLKVLVHGKGEDMKSWSDKLSHEELEAVVKYVRTLPRKKG